MSAIFGIFNVNDTPVQQAHLQMMRNKVARYGQADSDCLLAENIGLGCRMSGFGAHSQEDIPVYTDETAALTLICDALLWNRDELFAALGPAGGTSTQAILLKAYKRWGVACPNHINGDFAFVVWDKTQRQLFIARDHLGVRPLYYFYHDGVFAFATDIRALLCLPFVGRQPDEVILYANANGIHHIEPDASHFQQIKRLPQAHTLLVGANGLSTTQYWTPGANGRLRYDTEDAYAKALYAVVADAIRLRVNGVVGKIGAELSGGLDSSVISVVANRILKETGGGLAGLFSWSPPFSLVKQQPQDERVLIEAVCRQENFTCSYYEPDRQSMRQIPSITQEMHPLLLAGPDTLCAQGTRCILSGWGGDDAVSLRAGLYQLLLQGHVFYFLRQVARLSKGSPLRFIKVIAANTVMQWFRPFARFGRENSGHADILTPAFRRRTKRRCRRDILYFRTNPVKGIQSGRIQARTELSAVLDTVYGVTHLYPFLDYRVVDFAFSIPRTLYLKNGINRYVFRKAFAGVLPPEVASHGSKDDPVKSDYFMKLFTKEHMRHFADLLHRPLFDPYIDWAALERAIENNGTQTPGISRNLLSALYLKLSYCLDLQQELDDAAAEESPLPALSRAGRGHQLAGYRKRATHPKGGGFAVGQADRDPHRHRLSTVRNADNIIVIDDGRIAEQGTWDALMENKDSFLAKSLEIHE